MEHIPMKQNSAAYLRNGWLFLGAAAILVSIAAQSTGGRACAQDDSPVFPCKVESIAHYTARRTNGPIQVDGKLVEPSWASAERSPRFADMITGERAMHDTRAAVLWDDTNLYVAYWVEEPNVAASLTEYGSLIYTNNDVELFVAGRDAYYELELNAFNTLYEVFFMWEKSYDSGGFAAVSELRLSNPKVRRFGGVGFRNHPRGGRIGSWAWRFPGIRTAVQVDGTINDASDKDRGWTVEIALPWAGMEWLARADGRALPPRDGDVWRMDFSRFNQYKAPPPTRDSGGWVWSLHGVWDSHVPECFTIVHFAAQ
jgi:hypothetical protein